MKANVIKVIAMIYILMCILYVILSIIGNQTMETGIDDNYTVHKHDIRTVSDIDEILDIIDINCDNLIFDGFSYQNDPDERNRYNCLLLIYFSFPDQESFHNFIIDNNVNKIFYDIDKIGQTPILEWALSKAKIKKEYIQTHGLVFRNWITPDSGETTQITYYAVISEDFNLGFDLVLAASLHCRLIINPSLYPSILYTAPHL